MDRSLGLGGVTDLRRASCKEVGYLLPEMSNLRDTLPWMPGNLG